MSKIELEKANSPSSSEVKPQVKEAEATSKKIGFFEMYRFVSNLDRFFMVLGAICSTAEGTCMPLFALFFGDVPNTFNADSGAGGFVDSASKLALKFVYVGIGAFVSGYIGYASWMIVGEKASIEIRKRYFKSLLQQEIAFYDSINPNELSSKISDECFNIQQGVGEKVATFCHCIGLFFAGLIIGYTKGWQLALVLTGFAPVMGVAGSIFMLSMQKLSKINNDAYSRAGAISEEVLNAIRTVVSLSGQQKETVRYEKILEENSKVVRKFTLMAGGAVGFIVFAMQGVYALGFFVGSIFIKNEVHNPSADGPYTVGEVLTVFFAIMMMNSTPTYATPCIKAFTIAKENAAKAFAIIDRQSKISIADERGLKPSGCQGVMKFRDVKFAYPLKQERIILNGVSFDIRPNEKTAFVGESGCGKTTCMQLIERFYDLVDKEHGSITLDGNELKELNLKWMRENIGYVGQEPVLFATSIKENLMMAKENATDAEIWDALKKANAADFVQTLPDKLNTFVGNSGTALSGGQKQRLAIARAILKNPTILLLDEATSALDRKNEMEIQKTLDEISQGRTTIVIAHRLSTIINADHIIVFDGGKVVEEGNHEELVANKGKYYALQHLQLQTQEQDKKRAQAEAAAGTEKKHHQEVTLDAPEKEPLIEETATPVAPEVQLKVHNAPQVAKKKPETGAFSLFARLFTYSKDDIPIVIIGTICAMIYGMCQPFIAVLLANMLTILADPSASNFSSRAGLFSGLFLVDAFVAFISVGIEMALFNLAAERLARRIRKDVFKKFVRMPIGWFDEPANNAGALGSKLSTDATLVNNLISSVFGNYLQAVSSMVTGLVISLIADWRIALIGLGCAPFMTFAGMARANIAKKGTESGDDAYQESIAFASEAVNNMRTVASFGKEDKLLKNYSDKLSGPEKIAMRSAQLSGLALGGGNFITFGVYALIFYTSALIMRDHGIGFLNMFMAMMGIMLACMTVSSALQFAPDVGSAQKAALNIFHILDTKPAIDIDDPNQTVRTPIRGNIEFKNVWFKYPSREKQIFQNFNLKIEASKKVAMVGPSGCGKSTILALIQRFYDVDQGEILIDGVNIKQYDLKHLRGSFGVVSQEPVLFNGTIEYNLKYAKDTASMEEIREAATRANAIGFIENNEFDTNAADAAKFGTGFQRKVGPKGGQLSGGQKQRIAIARAILKNPSVLILDEATSALDAENEKTVQEALDKIMGGKTSVIVAHRISTIKDADEILVFNDGQIIERGNYQELTAMQGAFYKLERGTNQGVAR